MNQYEHQLISQPSALEPEAHRKLLTLVHEERRITVEVLRLLRKVEREMIYADLGYPSLFAYCTKALGYSESAAYRRIDSMRAIKEEPQIEKKIAAGELSLSTVSATRSIIRAHERSQGLDLSCDLKREIMTAVTNQSKRTAEKTAIQLIQSFHRNENPTAENRTRSSTQMPQKNDHRIGLISEPVSLKPSSERHLPSGLIRVTMELTEDEMKIIEDLRRLKSKTQNTKELFVSLARKELHQLKRKLGDAPLLRQRKLKTENVNPDGKGRTFPQSIRRTAWQRAQGKCEFVSRFNGKRCSATQGLEFDHQVPFAKGGSSERHNIRVLCRSHNVKAAVDEFGHSTMAQHVPSIRRGQIYPKPPGKSQPENTPQRTANCGRLSKRSTLSQNGISES